LPHQPLPLAKAELFVALVALQQAAEQVLVALLQRQRNHFQLPTQKSSEAVLTPLQVAKAALSLQLEALLEWCDPSLQLWG
jgi:hypothetical protein